MTMHNPNNERVKRQYFIFLKEARQHNEATVDAVAKAIARFEMDTKYRDFRAFHFEQAVAFKRRLADQESQSTGEKLSQATRYSTLAALKKFFQWLAEQPGFKSRLTYTDAAYFNLSKKETRVATARRARGYPTLEQVKHVIGGMPAKSELEMRNRALVAFTLLTGARDGAIASFKLKHVDMIENRLYQDARQVKTKFSKTFDTFFFPVGDDIRAIFAGWVSYLRVERLWGTEDPLFPATLTAIGANNQFEAIGIKREHWNTAGPIRGIFRVAFEAAGLQYFNPHSFRKTLVQLGLTTCQTAEMLKAWSQNLGHEDVMTTFHSYGEVGTRRQSEIMRDLATPPRIEVANLGALAKAVAQQLREADGYVP